MKSLVIGLVGVTNTGKSTLMDYLRKHPGFGTIEIGREMRRRYPPERFRGQGAMQDTEEEVWQIFDEQFTKAEEGGAAIILSDGQPRLPSQVYTMYEKVGDYRLLQLTAPHAVLCRRATERDQGDESKMELNRQRLVNDYQQLYEVMTEYLSFMPHKPIVVHTQSLFWLPNTLKALRSLWCAGAS